MAETILSPLNLEGFSIGHLALDVAGEPNGETREATVGLAYDFFQHESDENKFRVALKVNVRGGDDESPLFTLEVGADAFVELPVDCDSEIKGLLLTNSVALLYSTLRGSLASVMGQTAVRGFVLPSIDMNKVVQVRAAASEYPDELSASADSTNEDAAPEANGL